MTQAHTKEKLLLKQWGHFDLQPGPQEIGILRKWEIASIPEYIGKRGEANKIGLILDIWEPPLVSMYKLNFDGASKGNPSPTGYGGAIHNLEGWSVGLYQGYIGMNSNNVEELRGLLEGLTIAIQHGWLPLILEGDSQVILQMSSKLLHDKSISKVADNLKMTHSLELLRTLLQRHSKVQIHHVRRKANKLVDLVANYSPKKKQELQQKHWEEHIDEAF